MVILVVIPPIQMAGLGEIFQSGGRGGSMVAESQDGCVVAMYIPDY